MNEQDRIRFTTTARGADTSKLATAVERFVAGRKLPPRNAFRINLTIEELIANVTTHGRRRRHEPTVDIEIDIEPERIVLTFTDDGRRFDPANVPPPEQSDRLEQFSIGGLGLELVRRCADRFEYNVAGGWNRLRIEQQIAEAAT